MNASFLLVTGQRIRNCVVFPHKEGNFCCGVSVTMLTTTFINNDWYRTLAGIGTTSTVAGTNLQQ